MSRIKCLVLYDRMPLVLLTWTRCPNNILSWIFCTSKSMYYVMYTTLHCNSATSLGCHSCYKVEMTMTFSFKFDDNTEQE